MYIKIVYSRELKNLPEPERGNMLGEGRSDVCLVQCHRHRGQSRARVDKDIDLDTKFLVEIKETIMLPLSLKRWHFRAYTMAQQVRA